MGHEELKLRTKKFAHRCVGLAAMERFEILEKKGSSFDAFKFKIQYAPDGSLIETKRPASANAAV